MTDYEKLMKYDVTDEPRVSILMIKDDAPWWPCVPSDEWWEESQEAIGVEHEKRQIIREAIDSLSLCFIGDETDKIVGTNLIGLRCG